MTQARWFGGIFVYKRRLVNLDLLFSHKEFFDRTGTKILTPYLQPRGVSVKAVGRPATNHDSVFRYQGGRPEFLGLSPLVPAVPFWVSSVSSTKRGEIVTHNKARTNANS